jgi:hypothetical protein
MQIKIRESDLNARLRDFLKSQGFDGVQYKNTIEDRLAGDFSYIAFDPQQYKIVTASQFDPNDPRVYKAEGGTASSPKGKRIVGETEDYYLTNYGSGSVPKDMLRSDGSVKSAKGFLGPVKNNVQGGVMTEVSIGLEIDGKEIEVPAMVPTLTKDEINTLANMKIKGNAKNIPKSIMIKAKEHAQKRIKEGKSPFYKDGE